MKKAKKKTKPTAEEIRKKILKMTVKRFAKKIGLILGIFVDRFLERNRIKRVSKLLDTCTLQEDDITYRRLACLREELRKAGFDTPGGQTYRFFMTSI